MRFILKDVRQWKIRYDVLRFGVLFLVVVIIWAGIELVNTYSTTTIPEDYSEEIAPFNPSLDLEMISEIERRIDVDENFDVVVEGEEEEDEETPQPTPSPTPILIEASPPASGSGF